jgi:hypothetical protein
VLAAELLSPAQAQAVLAARSSAATQAALTGYLGTLKNRPR